MWIIKWSKGYGFGSGSGNLAVYFRSEFQASTFMRDYQLQHKDYELTIKEI